MEELASCLQGSLPDSWPLLEEITAVVTTGISEFDSLFNSDFFQHDEETGGLFEQRDNKEPVLDWNTLDNNNNNGLHKVEERSSVIQFKSTTPTSLHEASHPATSQVRVSPIKVIKRLAPRPAPLVVSLTTKAASPRPIAPQPPTGQPSITAYNRILPKQPLGGTKQHLCVPRQQSLLRTPNGRALQNQQASLSTQAKAQGRRWSACKVGKAQS